MTGSGDTGNLISVHPDEIKFIIELEKQSHCHLKITNKTEHHVAFKVKTTSPKKYIVRPNTGIAQPWDSYFVRVTLQAQQEYPSDMQCKDKFLLQSTIVPPYTELDDLPPNTFTKEGGKALEECKLKVVYVSPGSGNSETEALMMSDKQSPNSNFALLRLKDERDAAVRQTQQLQQELDLLKKQSQRKTDLTLSFKFTLLVGFIGTMFGFLLNLLLSSPPME